MRINVTRRPTDIEAGTKCTTLGPTAFAGCRDVDVIIRSTALSTLNGGQKGYVTGKAPSSTWTRPSQPALHHARSGPRRLPPRHHRQLAGRTTSAVGFTAYTSTGKVFHEAFLGGSKPIRQTGTKSVTNTVLIGGGYISSHP